MIVGIIIVQSALLPHTCPYGATCPNFYDPKGNVLPLVQTLMQHRLQIGTTVASCGQVKLMAYQSWSVMKKQGNTIENLLKQQGICFTCSIPRSTRFVLH